MRILFLAFVFSIVALLWTLLALRRHVHRHRAQPGDSMVFQGTPHENTHA